MADETPMVTVDDHLLGPYIDWRTAHESYEGDEPRFLVLSADPLAAAAVLLSTSTDFYFVAEDGRWLTEEELESVHEGVEPGDELYTPNYVSNPRVLDEGAFVHVDCKNMLYPPMVRTMVGILVNALTSAGVAGRITAFDRGEDGGTSLYARSREYSAGDDSD